MITFLEQGALFVKLIYFSLLVILFPLTFSLSPQGPNPFTQHFVDSYHQKSVHKNVFGLFVLDLQIFNLKRFLTCNN